jgi:Protein of unknown function (DUF2442)
VPLSQRWGRLFVSVGYALRTPTTGRTVAQLTVRAAVDLGMRKGPMFRPLADRTFFDQVGIVNGALMWPNETDIAPDAMYGEATGRSGW